MAKHKTFSVGTNVKVYFCDPHSPWQRGTSENTNRLLRQYLPKRTDLSGYPKSELDKIALRLNRPMRKTLGFETPASKLRASVSSAHWSRTTYRAQPFRAIVVRDACTNIQTISRSMGHTITSITSQPGFELRVPGT